MMIKLIVMSGIILLASQVCVTAASAKSLNPTLDETVTLRMGAFWANFDATVKAYGQDFNQDESIDAGDVDFSISGLWRITPRLRLEAGYTGISKESTESLDAATNVGSLTIPAGLSLNSKFETEVLRLSLGYAFMRSDSSEFGVNLGVNVTSIKESFRANIPGHSGINITTFDVSEPLPTIGLFFNYAFSSEWYFTSRFGAFAFDIGDIDGTIFDAFGGVEYRPWQNVGFGLAYMYNSADLTITDGGIKTDIEYDYNGPLLYLTVGF